MKKKTNKGGRLKMQIDGELVETKRASSETSDTSSIQDEKGGATPTDALQ